MAGSVRARTDETDRNPGIALNHSRSLWIDALRRLQANRVAVAAGIAFLLIIAITLAAPLLAPEDPTRLNARDSLTPPGPIHWMGTDQYGRDILSRVLYGGRVSILMGFVAVSISLTGGTLLGLVSGYYRGIVDLIVMRVVDVMLSFPGILLALVVVAIIGPQMGNAMIAVGISAMPTYIRVVRGTVLSIVEREYIGAAWVLGGTDRRIIFRHVLPNVISPLVVLAALGIPNAIISGAALSFLGLGVRPPTPDWGEMLSNGRDFISAAWWLSTFPGLAIAAMVATVNLFGDGIRDALDPRLKL